MIKHIRYTSNLKDCFGAVTGRRPGNINDSFRVEKMSRVELNSFVRALCISKYCLTEFNDSAFRTLKPE